jgi:hypothetical protein
VKLEADSSKPNHPTFHFSVESIAFYNKINRNIFKMVPRPDGKSATGGVYNVTESGIEFNHMPPLDTPIDGAAFLERFR